MAMNMANTYPADAGTSGISAGGLVRRLVEGWREHRRYQRTLAELGGLTDRELADIGLSRGEVDLVARRSARRFL